MSSNKTKIVTQEDLDNNPQLAKDGVKVGDTIFVDDSGQEEKKDEKKTDTDTGGGNKGTSDGRAVGGQSDPYPKKDAPEAGNQATQQREKEEKHLANPTTGTKKEVEDLHQQPVQTGTGTQNAHQSNAIHNSAAPGETATSKESIKKENEGKLEEERLKGDGSSSNKEQSQSGSAGNNASQGAGNSQQQL